MLIRLIMNIQFCATLYHVVGETVCRENLHSVIMHTFKWLVITNLHFDSLSQSWVRTLSKIPYPNRSLAGWWPGESSMQPYCSTITLRLPSLRIAAGQTLSMLKEMAPGPGHLGRKLEKGHIHWEVIRVFALQWKICQSLPHSFIS